MKSAFDRSAAGEISTWDQRLHSARDTLDFQIGTSSSARYPKSRPNFLFDLHHRTVQTGLSMDLSYNLHPHILSIIISHTIIPTESSRPQASVYNESKLAMGVETSSVLSVHNLRLSEQRKSPQLATMAAIIANTPHCRHCHHSLQAWLLSNCSSGVWNVCGVGRMDLRWASGEEAPYHGALCG